ncbi:MAG: glycosyltransferase WbsX family protein [Proteobacteria bacterium]|nr:glycosyltransferase WbsX family protein [Pseudomonadota bacterium]
MASARVIAFYLTQFHPIPENDRWWGEGFTEWTNVVRGRPYYPGHRQPQLPGETGFYDLRDEATRARQSALAAQFGIDGFCFYYYWFAGKRLLEAPVEAMLAGGAPDFPFCLCWANENWTRRWDGKDHEVLIAQEYSENDDVSVVHDLMRHFRDSRYIRVDGKPLMIVYRMDLHPDPARLVRIWRRECLDSGIGEIYLCTVRRFGMPDAARVGVDALIDFPPLGCVASELTRAMNGLDPGFDGRIFDYMDLARDALNRTSREYANFPGVVPSWDNTARKGPRAHVYHGASPLRYRAWLAEAIRTACESSVLPEPLVFINAWNEWAEGCHLEVDAEYGTAWLEATRAARLDAMHQLRLWTLFGVELPLLPVAEERRLAGAPLSSLLGMTFPERDLDCRSTRLELLLAAIRRRVEVSPRARRAVLPIARLLGMAD